eukprot:UN09264
MSNALPDNQLNDLLASLGRGGMQPRDQLKKLSALAASNTVTAAQIIAIIEVVRTIQVDAIVTLYPALADKSTLDTILAKLKFADEREEVKKRISV